MENPLSVRANAFAIDSIMSDPEVAAEFAYGYCAGAAQHQHPVTSSVSAAAQCRMSATATSGGDCQYQNDWTLHHQQRHHQTDVNGYTGGLKAMEGLIILLIFSLIIIIITLWNFVEKNVNGKPVIGSEMRKMQEKNKVSYYDPCIPNLLLCPVFIRLI